MFKNICIIIGGPSVERDISLISGLQLENNINKQMYKTTVVYLDGDYKFKIGEELRDIKTFQNGLEQLAKPCEFVRKNDETYIKYKTFLKEKYKKIDCVIIALHGKGTEDGTIAGYFDMLNVPYISSDMTSSSIIQNKAFTKDILQASKINTLNYQKVYSIEELNSIEINYPVIIKPTCLGSSIAINTAYDELELKTYVTLGLKYDKSVIIEPLLTNFKEYNQAIYQKDKEFITSNIEEVIKNDEILSFSDKYLEESSQSRQTRIIPAQISQETEEHITNLTKKVYKKFNAKGIIRIDYLLESKTNKIYVNEINSIPGSFANYLFDKEKITFEQLINDQIEESYRQFEKNKDIIKCFKSSVLLKNTKKLRK